MKKDISRFLDVNGRIKVLPAKKEMKSEILKHLSTKFEYGRFYTEKEVNGIIESWHTFGDYFLIRRELIDSKLLARTNNGAKYWREEQAEPNDTEQRETGIIKTERLTIKPSGFEELPELNKIFEQVVEYFSFDPSHTAVSPEKCLAEGDLPPGGVKGNYQIYTVFENNCAIGYLDCYKGFPETNVVYISLMFIDERNRKHGYGKEIMNSIEKYYKALGFKEIMLAVSLKNWPGLKFWYKCGFDKITRVAADDTFTYEGYGCLGLKKAL